MPFLGTQRCSCDKNFPLLITLFLELFRYLVVDCHLRWDILRRFDLRTRITVQSPHALNPMGAPFSPQLNCNGGSDSTELYTDVIRIPMILRCTLVQ